MENFTWTEAYSVGVKEIDEQHKRFFKITNDVITHSVTEASATKEKLLELAEKLGDYANFHLNTEEKYFDKFECSFPPHIEAHDEFRKQVRVFLAEIRMFNSDFKPIAQSMALFCGHWLSQHIFVMDKGYTECFNKHGLR